MSPRGLVRRRPSAALVISFLALFVALGGAGWAAIHVPPNSVGSAQLQNFSVGYLKLKSNSVGPRKIIPGSVGAAQVNSSEVQLRVAGPCSIGAIQSIAVSGDVTCTPALPSEYGTNGVADVGTGPTSVATLSLPPGNAGSSYLAIADVRFTAMEIGTGTTSFVESCSLSAGTTSAAVQDTVRLDNPQTNVSGVIPLVLPVDVTAQGQTANVVCQDIMGATPTPLVTATATINAIQTAANH